MKTCYLYIRSATQNKENFQSQFEACFSYAQKKNYAITSVYADFGSGLKVNKALSNLIKKQDKTSEKKKLIVYDISRLSRDTHLTKSIIADLKKANIEVEYVNQPQTI